MPASPLQNSLEYYEAHIDSGKTFYMDAEALVDIIDYYVRNNRTFDAERCLRFALHLHPDNDEVRITHAYRLKADNKWGEAHKIIAAVADQTIRDVQLFYVEEFAAMGCPMQSEEALKQALPKPFCDADYDWYVDAAEIYLDYGYYIRALKWLNGIPSGNPEQKHIYELMAEAYGQTGQGEKAIEAATAMVDEDPYDAVSWAQLAELHQKNEQYAKTIDACDFALAIEPNSKRALLLKALGYVGQGKGDEALKVCQTCISIFPDDFYAYLYAGEVLYDRRDYDQAYLMLHKAMKYSAPDVPERPRILSGLAYCSIGLGRDDEAVEVLQTSLLTGASLSDVYLQAALLFLDQGKQEQAGNLIYAIAASRYLNSTIYLRIVEMLTQYKCYLPALRTWLFLFAETKNRPMEAMPHLALAARFLRSPKHYEQFITAAILLCPKATQDLFNPVMKTSQLDEILKKAHEEIEGLLSEEE